MNENKTNINWYPGHMAKNNETNRSRLKNCRHSNRTVRC